MCMVRERSSRGAQNFLHIHHQQLYGTQSNSKDTYDGHMEGRERKKHKIIYKNKVHKEIDKKMYSHYKKIV